MKKFQAIKYCFSLICLGVLVQLAVSANAMVFTKWDVYPFSLEVPDSLQPFTESERNMFRSSLASQSAELYKRYSGFNDSHFSAVPYVAAFCSQDFDVTLIATVMRIPPQTNYLGSISKDFAAKKEFGKKNGFIKAMSISAPSRLGNYDSIIMEMEKPNGDRDFVGILFDDVLPYQVIMLSFSSPGNRAAESREAFDHILKNLKIDYTLRGKVGNQPFVISKRCQEFLVVTEISNPNAKEITFVIQEPHWDWRGQWNLHQGLRVLFDENANLLTNSAFLSEGLRAMEQTAVTSLTQVEPQPEPVLVKATLESFLVTGYLTFNWMTGNQIPVFGTEDWPLYQESASLWQSEKIAPWAVTVAARNEKMVEVLSALQIRFDNPMLFVGGMHIHAIDKNLFIEGQGALDVNSPSSGKSNLGVKDWLKQKGIDYIYIEPFPDLSLQDEASAIARYRELFVAQIGDNYQAYIEKFAAGYQSRFATGVYDEGVTVTPKPAEAAKLVVMLQKASDGGDDSSKSGDSRDENKSGGSIRKAIDRFKDALSRVNLRGKGLKSGRNAIRDTDPNLNETRDETGRHEWTDKNGRVRARYDPKGANEDAHWDKYAPDGTRIDNAGRPGVEHIPAQ